MLLPELPQLVAAPSRSLPAPSLYDQSDSVSLHLLVSFGLSAAVTETDIETSISRQHGNRRRDRLTIRATDRVVSSAREVPGLKPHYATVDDLGTVRRVLRGRVVWSAANTGEWLGDVTTDAVPEAGSTDALRDDRDGGRRYRRRHVLVSPSRRSRRSADWRRGCQRRTHVHQPSCLLSRGADRRAADSHRDLDAARYLERAIRWRGGWRLRGTDFVSADGAAHQ